MKNEIKTAEVQETVQNEIVALKTIDYRKVGRKVLSVTKTALAVFGTAVIVTIAIDAITKNETEEV
jgi:hypothetical protein